jgi:hypothetical protein
VAVPAAAREHLEALLRARHLDRTLTTSLPALSPDDDRAFAPIGIPALDRTLGGGLVRGHLSEIAGPRSSGRAAILVAALAAATGRGEATALIDPLDQFDPSSAAAAGLSLSRVLWVRGSGRRTPVPTGRVSIVREWSAGHTDVDQALKAMSLVLQAGNFGMVALDMGEVPAMVLRRVPFTTWMRLQRGIEGSHTVGLIAAPEPIARSTHGATIALGRQPAVAAVADKWRRRFGEHPITARVIQPRRMRTEAETTLTMSAVVV